MAVTSGANNIIPGNQFAQHLQMSSHMISVNLENARIEVARDMIEAFQNNIKNEMFFTISNKWEPISAQWKARKRKMGRSTHILQEKFYLLHSFRYRGHPGGKTIDLNPEAFHGPDKRHFSRRYGAVHNLGLAGSGGPRRAVQRQFMGYIPKSTTGKFSLEAIKSRLSAKVFLGVPGRFVTI